MCVSRCLCEVRERCTAFPRSLCCYNGICKEVTHTHTRMQLETSILSCLLIHPLYSVSLLSSMSKCWLTRKCILITLISKSTQNGFSMFPIESILTAEPQTDDVKRKAMRKNLQHSNNRFSDCQLSSFETFI